MTTISPSPASDTFRPGLVALFLCFLEVALCSFGGAAAWARRILVERRRWLSEEAFLNALSLCQILPGPNVVNLSVHIGARFHGVPGAVAAFTGLTLAPVLIVIGLDVAYLQFHHLPTIRAALGGVSAAAAGLVIGTAAKMIGRRRPLHWFALAAAAFVAVGVLRWPLLPVLLALAPLALTITWWLEARS